MNEKKEAMDKLLDAVAARVVARELTMDEGKEVLAKHKDAGFMAGDPAAAKITLMSWIGISDRICVFDDGSEWFVKWDCLLYKDPKTGWPDKNKKRPLPKAFSRRAGSRVSNES